MSKRAEWHLHLMVLQKSTQFQAIALNFQTGSIPAWVQLTPAGPEIEGRDGRKFRLSDPQSVVNAFLANEADLPIDVEHSTQIKGAEGEPAPAVGWIKELEVREGAIWGRVEWTGDGQWFVGDRQYRYLSPAFTHEKKSLEIVELVSAGLTNQPNLKMAALNKQGDPEETIMDRAVLEALGLAPTATAADAVVAINNMRNDHETALNSARQIDVAKYVPISDHEAALNRIKDFEKQEADAVETAINAAVDAGVAAGKITPASRDFHVAACKASGIEAFEAHLKGLPVIAPVSGLDTKSDAASGSATALNASQKEVARQLGLTGEDYAKRLNKEAQQ